MLLVQLKACIYAYCFSGMYNCNQVHGALTFIVLSILPWPHMYVQHGCVIAVADLPTLMHFLPPHRTDLSVWK